MRIQSMQGGWLAGCQRIHFKRTLLFQLFSTLHVFFAIFGYEIWKWNDKHENRSEDEIHVLLQITFTQFANEFERNINQDRNGKGNSKKRPPLLQLSAHPLSERLIQANYPRRASSWPKIIHLSIRPCLLVARRDNVPFSRMETKLNRFPYFSFSFSVFRSLNIRILRIKCTASQLPTASPPLTDRKTYLVRNRFLSSFYCFDWRSHPIQIFYVILLNDCLL